MFACRSHSDRQKSRGRKKKKEGRAEPAEAVRAQQRRGERKRLMSPVRWESPPLSAPSFVLAPHPSSPPPSRRLSADCLALSLPIRPIALCRRHAQHLSYHCPDNSLLVQKSLRALRSHDDDMVTLPGGSEPPAEIAYPFSAPSVSFSAHPFASLSLFLAAARPTLQSLTGVCKRAHAYRQMGL